MSTMTIRNLDDQVKRHLRIRAARHGRSMEDEARDILRSSLSTDTTDTGALVESIRARIEPLGGIDLGILPRGAIRKPPTIDE
jgi:plasmid stability protein